MSLSFSESYVLQLQKEGDEQKSQFSFILNSHMDSNSHLQLK